MSTLSFIRQMRRAWSNRHQVKDMEWPEQPNDTPHPAQVKDMEWPGTPDPTNPASPDGQNMAADETDRQSPRLRANWDLNALRAAEYLDALRQVRFSGVGPDNYIPDGYNYHPNPMTEEPLYPGAEAIESTQVDRLFSAEDSSDQDPFEALTEVGAELDQIQDEASRVVNLLEDLADSAGVINQRLDRARQRLAAIEAALKVEYGDSNQD